MEKQKIFFTSDLHFGHENVIRFDNRTVVKQRKNAGIPAFFFCIFEFWSLKSYCFFL